MHSLHFFFLIFVTLSQSHNYPELQSQVLCAIRNAFINPWSNTCNTTYNCTSTTEISLDGLEVNCDDNTFQTVNISFSSLSSIPTQIGLLTMLNSLYIYSNPLLSGTIPTEIGTLTSLQQLWISENLILSGTIPSEIGKLSSLTTLDFSENPLLSGTIPTEIGKLTSLQQLYFYYYQLLSGTIPSEIGNLSLLIDLWIADNPLLSGTIPSEIGNLISLQFLDISEDPLISGTIPSEFGKLTSLQQLYIYKNHLSGTIPSEIGKLSLLQFLFLRENSLSGSVPSELSNCSLVMLYLSDNYFSVLPDEFPQTLRELDLSFNNFSGSLSYNPIWGLTQLIQLDLSYNFFSGQVQLYNLESAILISLAFNSLTTIYGYIEGNSVSPFLLSLDLSHNQFTGIIPSDFGLFTTLEVLNLQDNQFSGTITDALSSLNYLEELYLNNNQLNGTIPLFLPSHIQLLYLQSNNLTGTIPEYLGKFKYLNSIDFSDLNICGCFPSGFANINWLSCSLTGVSYNSSCNNIPQNCDLKIVDPTVNCDIPDQCSSGIAKCSNQRSCIKNGYGYICGNCPSGYNEDGLYNCVPTLNIVIIVVPAILGLLIIVIGIVLWKKYNQPMIEIDLPNSWFWDYERTRNYQKSNTEPVYYFTNVKERSKEKEYLDELMEKLDFGDISIKEVIAVVSPVLAGIVSGAYQIQKSRMVKNPQQFNKKDWKKKDDADIRKKIISIFESKMKSFSWNEKIENSPVIPVVHGTDEDIAWKIASGGFAALSTLDAGFYGKGIYFSSSALYTIPYFGSKKKPVILICLTIPGNPYPVTEDPTGPKNLSLVGEHIKTGYQSHYVVTKKNGMPFQREDYDTNQKQYDELIISQEAQVVPIFLLKVSDINLGRLMYEHQREISVKDNEPDNPYILF